MDLSLKLLENNEKPDVIKDLIELIEIAKRPLKKPFKKRTASDSRLDETRRFIQECEIEAHGTVLVPASLIYDKYEKWCKRNGAKTKGVSAFFGKFKLYFNSRQLNGKAHYYIHPKGFDLSIQNIELVQNGQKTKTQKRRSA